MPRKIEIKCAIAGCHRRLRMTLAQREELRRVGREHHGTAGLVCPAHVKAAFNFEFDDIDIDVPMGEFLVEASKDTPRWRVMLTPLPGAAGEPESQSTPGSGDRVIYGLFTLTGALRQCACSQGMRSVDGRGLPCISTAVEHCLGC